MPCFATSIPAALKTNADVVEMLKLSDLSPPVPTISRTSLLCGSCKQYFLNMVAAAVISSMVSPFMESAVRNALICISLTAPLIILSKAFSVISRLKDFP